MFPHSLAPPAAITQARNQTKDATDVNQTEQNVSQGCKREADKGKKQEISSYHRMFLSCFEK